MKRIGLLLIAALMALPALAQERSLSFTSVNSARFFVYLNGRLQNEKSVGSITLKGLEDKEYHVRIVIDDPYVVATTKKMRPAPGNYEWTVDINAVRERVYLREAKEEKPEIEEQEPPRQRVRERKSTPKSEETRPAARVDLKAGGAVNRERTETVLEN